MPLVHFSDWIDELRHLCIITSWSTVMPKLLKRDGQLLSPSCFWSTPSGSRRVSDQKAAVLLTLGRDNICQYKNQRKLGKKFARTGLLSEYCVLKTASGQTVPGGSDLWYMRQVPDHCPNKSELYIGLILSNKFFNVRHFIFRFFFVSVCW